MSAADLIDRYEALRRRLTGRTSGGGDGLVVIRRQGLHAWIAYATTTPSPRRCEPPPSPALGRPCAAAIEWSPLLGLCADMMLAKLVPQATP